jgi:hypothetical protein
MFISQGKTRSRSLKGPGFTLREATHSGTDRKGSLLYGPALRTSTGGIQITESDGNRWPLPKGSDLVDSGSEFFTRKTEVVTPKFPFTVLTTNRKSVQAYRQIEGNLIANCFNVHRTGTAPNQVLSKLDQPLSFSFPPDLSSSRQDLVVKGTQAIAACEPGNAIAGAASSIGELLQDVPSIPGISLWESRLRAIETLASTGDEFLNIVFGLLPTISDMQQFLKAVHNIDRAVDQFIRDSGRVVRRSFTFPIEESSTETVLADTVSPAGMCLRIGTLAGVVPGPPIDNAGWALPAFETVRIRAIKRECWFDGAFTYHLPGGYDSHSSGDRRKLMAKLFGAEPDLNTLWQLAPWSWAVDWFSDAGSFVKNLQNKINYGTVMRYGYVMETTTVTDTYIPGTFLGYASQTGMDVLDNPSLPVPSAVVLRTTTKKRIKASPFGFGLSWDGLSTVQQAILAALGITRAAR